MAGSSVASARASRASQAVNAAPMVPGTSPCRSSTPDALLLRSWLRLSMPFGNLDACGSIRAVLLRETQQRRSNHV